MRRYCGIKELRNRVCLRLRYILLVCMVPELALSRMKVSQQNGIEKPAKIRPMPNV